MSSCSESGLSLLSAYGSQMTIAHQPSLLLIPEPEREGFETVISQVVQLA